MTRACDRESGWCRIGCVGCDLTAGEVLTTGISPGGEGLGERKPSFTDVVYID